MRQNFAKPNFTATMMAAVPYRDMDKAAQVILENFPEAPCLPVMTRSMRWLFEGIPCLVIDREKKQIYMASPEDKEEELLEFYNKYDQKDLEHFATTSQTAPFFYSILEKLKEDRPHSLKWVVFHTAGPVLVGDMLKQANGRPSIQHETLRDVIIKALNMKARWLEKKIKEEIPEVEVVADLPETTLVSFTSAGGTGSREEIISAINEGFSELNCLTWVHCCANIDWTLLTESNVNVINFDAYQHTENVALYSNEIQIFLENGGMIGWGIVPVIEDLLSKESVESLTEKLQRGIDLFVSKGIEEELLVTSSWVLPACETVMLSPEQSDLVFKMTKEISQEMKRKYGFE
jgi:hypothetical protein